LPPQLGTAALVQRLLVMPRAEDAGKKVKGRKRPIITDTLGLLVGAAIHPGDVQDRDGAVWYASTFAQQDDVSVDEFRLPGWPGLAEKGGRYVPLPPVIGDDRHRLLVVTG
jgi:hypothetical protein